MRLALIGVGLIGGSFARALRAAGRVDQIVGFDTDGDVLARAVELGVIDEQAGTAAQAAEKADLVMIAVPVGATAAVLREIRQNLPDTAIVTDVGSSKSGVVDAARQELGTAFPRFVPGHPIAGSERSGVAHSDAELFRDALFVSTPMAQTHAEALRHVEGLWEAAGAHSKRMAPDEHDDLFAAVSHLPHLLAFALLAQIAVAPDSEKKFAMAGAGFRDFTRIGASNPALWTDVCLGNRSALGAHLTEFRALLKQLHDALESADAASIQQVFSRGALARRENAFLFGSDPAG